MSEQSTSNRRSMIWWLLSIFVAALVIVYFIARERYTNEMISAVDDSLIKHDLIWAGRGADFAQYVLVLHGRDGATYQGTYRVPASVDPVPAIVVLHANRDTLEILEWLKDVPGAAQCAIVGVNVADYLARDDDGRVRSSNKWLGRSLLPSLHAVDLAIEFVSGHRIVDTEAIYVAAELEANLVGVPAAVNSSESLSGLSCMHPSAMMNLRDWDSDGFASPIYWAERVSGLRLLIVHDEAAETNAVEFVKSLDQAGRASELSPRDSFVGGMAKTIEWVMKDREGDESDETEEPSPIPSRSTVVRR